jgi:KDO2-lipid IV(A) lauroyltransferase
MKSEMFAYYLYRFAGFLAPLFPLRLGHWLMDRIADLLARLRSEERAIVRSNILHVLGSDPGYDALDRMAYNTYRCSMKNYFDLFWMASRSGEKIRALVDADGMEHLDAAFDMGKGVIVASFHYGNPEVTLQMVPLVGKPCQAPAEHVKPEALYQYLCKLRTKRGLTLFPIDGPLTEILRALRRGDVIGLALDRDATDSGREVEFFGSPAHLPDGTALLALRTGAPVLVVLSRRLPGNRYSMRAFPPIVFPVTRQPDDATVLAAMRRILSVVEPELRKDPSQWVVFRRIWND